MPFAKLHLLIYTANYSTLVHACRQYCILDGIIRRIWYCDFLHLPKVTVESTICSEKAKSSAKSKRVMEVGVENHRYRCTHIPQTDLDSQSRTQWRCDCNAATTDSHRSNSSTPRDYCVYSQCSRGSRRVDDIADSFNIYIDVATL